MTVKITMKEPGVYLELSEEAMNIIGSNPFKFPKPQDMKPMKEENGRQVPNVPFTRSMEFIYTQCLGFLGPMMLSSIKTLHGKVNKENVTLNEFKVGNCSVNRLVYLSFWELQASLTCLRPSLTYEDLDLLLRGTFPMEEDVFCLEISSARIKPKEEHQARRQGRGPSRAQLEHDGGRTK